MSDEAGEKKFDVSHRRREQLRQEGVIPRSQDISTATTLAAGLAMLLTGGGMLIHSLQTVMTNAFLQVGRSTVSLTPETVGGVMSGNVWFWIGGFVSAMAIAVLVTQVAQVGINFQDDPFSFKFEKLNPISGLTNLFSMSRVVQTGQSLIKLSVVGSFAWMSLETLSHSAAFSRPVSLEELGTIYTDAAQSLGWRIVSALGVLAAADYLYQRWKFNHDNMMTLEEVKEERRSMEASPEVVKKRRMMARKTSMRRMLENMKDATIVVTNPTHYAVALKYRRGETEVPIVVAKGMRLSALRIKERAYDLRIVVRENKPLARGLYKYGRVDQPIPAAFYQGVAIILASLYRQGFQASPERGKRVDSELDLKEILNQEKD